MIAVRLRDRLVRTHAAQRVLRDDAPLSKSSVVRHVLWWARLVLPTRAVLVRSTRLTSGCVAICCALWVQLPYPYVRQVSFSTYSLGKSLHQARLLEQGDVGSGSAHAVPHVTDRAGVQIHV